MLQTGSSMASNDPKKILLAIHYVLRHFFQTWGVGALNFCLSVENGTREGGGGIKNLLKPKLLDQNSSNMA